MNVKFAHMKSIQYYDLGKEYNYTWHYRHTCWSKRTLLDAVTVGRSCYISELSRSVGSKWAFFVLCHYFVQWANVPQALAFKKSPFLMEDITMCQEYTKTFK